MSDKSSNQVAIESAQSTAAALETFYADHKLMRRNVLWISLGYFGNAASLVVVIPLMNLRLKAVGMSVSGIGFITAANLWAVSFLVMYFSWKSDHHVSRLGRRVPYVLSALPFLVAVIALFPFFNEKWLLVGLMAVFLFFQDVMNSTYPLLKIDCVSREILARVSGITAISVSLGNFLAMRAGAKLADRNQPLLFLVCAAILATTILLAAFRVKEPPIHNPATEKFNLLAPIKVACRDKRILVLMAAVAMLSAFSAIYSTWLWFFAKATLDMTPGETGAAISWSLLLSVVASYPAGWLIDRFGSYVALSIEWVMMLAMMLTITYGLSPRGLIAQMMLFSLFTPLQVAGDTILWKMISKKDIGSYTATVSLIRNFCTGSVIFASGYVIRWTGNYVSAFWFGFSMSSAALVMFVVYRHLMKNDGVSTEATVNVVENSLRQPEDDSMSAIDVAPAITSCFTSTQ